MRGLEFARSERRERSRVRRGAGAVALAGILSGCATGSVTVVNMNGAGPLTKVGNTVAADLDCRPGHGPSYITISGGAEEGGAIWNAEIKVHWDTLRDGKEEDFTSPAWLAARYKVAPSTTAHYKAGPGTFPSDTGPINTAYPSPGLQIFKFNAGFATTVTFWTTKTPNQVGIACGLTLPDNRKPHDYPVLYGPIANAAPAE